jgi:CcmD family protein
MLWPLAINFVAFLLLFFYLLALRMRVNDLEYEVRRARLYRSS